MKKLKLKFSLSKKEEQSPFGITLAPTVAYSDGSGLGPKRVSQYDARSSISASELSSPLPSSASFRYSRLATPTSPLPSLDERRFSNIVQQQLQTQTKGELGELMGQLNSLAISAQNKQKLDNGRSRRKQILSDVMASMSSKHEKILAVIEKEFDGDKAKIEEFIMRFVRRHSEEHGDAASVVIESLVKFLYSRTKLFRQQTLFLKQGIPSTIPDVERALLAPFITVTSLDQNLRRNVYIQWDLVPEDQQLVLKYLWHVFDKLAADSTGVVFGVNLIWFSREESAKAPARTLSAIVETLQIIPIQIHNQFIVSPNASMTSFLEQEFTQVASPDLIFCTQMVSLEEYQKVVGEIIGRETVQLDLQTVPIFF